MHYNYVAIDKAGKRVMGEIDAENAKAAADLVRGQALMPVSLQTGSTSPKNTFNVKNLFGTVALLDKINFIKNFAVMLRSGFPASRAIRVLAQQATNPTMAEALGDIASQVESGQSLSDGMNRHPKIFSTMFVNVVKVGEVSGNLEESLMNLAGQMQKDYELVRKTKGAMIYPAVVLSAMVIIMILMFTFVLPKLTQMFVDFDVQLPLPTRILISMVDFMKSYGIFVLFGFVGAIIGFFAAMRRPSVQAVADAVVLKLPVVGRVVHFTNVARFARTLSSLLHSGMPILESVKITGESLSNARFRSAMAKIEGLVRAGSPLSGALRGYPDLFPPLLVNMIAVGEESGTVDTTLSEVALFYESEVDQVVSNLSSVLEPLLMLMVGVGVGVLAIALIMPIYSITQNI